MNIQRLNILIKRTRYLRALVDRLVEDGWSIGIHTEPSGHIHPNGWCEIENKVIRLWQQKREIDHLKTLSHECFHAITGERYLKHLYACKTREEVEFTVCRNEQAARLFDKLLWDRELCALHVAILGKPQRADVMYDIAKMRDSRQPWDYQSIVATYQPSVDEAWEVVQARNII